MHDACLQADLQYQIKADNVNLIVHLADFQLLNSITRQPGRPSVCKSTLQLVPSMSQATMDDKDSGQVVSAVNCYFMCQVCTPY